MKSTAVAGKLGAAVGLIVGSLAIAPMAIAQDKKPEPDFTLAGNAGLYSDYRFRGFSQTGYKPAFQGGFDFSTKAGFYLGNWNSNVEQGLYTGASLEMDFYGGYKGSIGDIGYDLGYLYYYYPNSGALGATKIDNGELYVGASYGPFAAKWFYGTTQFFALGDPPTNGNFDTKGSWYLDLAGNFDMGGGFTINAHYGIQKIKNGKTAFAQGIVFTNEDMIADYKLGVTKDLDGWLLGAAVIGTSEKGHFHTAQSGLIKDAGKTAIVVSVSKSF